MTWLLKAPDGVALLLCLVLCLAAVAIGLRRRQPRPDDDEQVDTWPHLIRAEFLVSLAALALVCLWALLLDPPLGAAADPSLTPAVTRAPWFLVGVQELLQYFAPWLGAVVLPLLLVAGLIMVPFLDPDGWGGPARLGRRIVPSVVVAVLALLVAIPAVVGQLFRGPHWRLEPAWQPHAFTPDPVPSPVAGAVDLVVLLPLLLVGPLWLKLRTRPWAVAMGRGRFLAAASILGLLAGALLRVALAVTA